jgi:hypothetical protein
LQKILNVLSSALVKTKVAQILDRNLLFVDVS